MKRTLLVTIDFPPMFGGVANYWANLCKFMPSDDFVVLAPEYHDSLDFDIKQDYLIYRKNLISKKKWLWPKWLPLFLNTYRLIKQEKIKKIIAAHVLPAGTVAYIFKKFLRIPYIISAHGLDIALPQANKRKNWLMKKIIANADQIIVNSNFTKNLLLELECCSPQSITIIYPCPNIKIQEPPKRIIDRLEEKFQIRDKKVILTVGRLIERKGQDKVVQAMPKILEKVPNAIYLIVGQGLRRKYLVELRQALKIENHIKIFSDILDEELPAFYSSADVFIMPSRRLGDGDIEGFGIVYLEANSYGKPVIAGKSGGAVEAVEHNVNGLLVDPLSINEISEAIICLLTNEQKARELGERGRLRVAQKFNWYEQAKKVIELIG